MAEMSNIRTALSNDRHNIMSMQNNSISSSDNFISDKLENESKSYWETMDNNKVNLSLLNRSSAGHCNELAI